jgi:hypothetical protein
MERAKITSASSAAPASQALPIRLSAGVLRAASINGFRSGDLPTISEESSPVDVLVMAETLWTSVLAFLTPEEIAEHRKTIGFHTEEI